MRIRGCGVTPIYDLGFRQRYAEAIEELITHCELVRDIRASNFWKKNRDYLPGGRLHDKPVNQGG